MELVMKIKMLTSMSGVEFTRNVGEEVDVDADEARRLVDAQFAEALEEFPPANPGNSGAPNGAGEAGKESGKAKG
jgi:hypothetical protein